MKITTKQAERLLDIIRWSRGYEHYIGGAGSITTYSGGSGLTSWFVWTEYGRNDHMSIEVYRRGLSRQYEVAP